MAKTNLLKSEKPVSNRHVKTSIEKLENRSIILGFFGLF